MKQPEQVRARKLREAGQSIRDIARRLNVSKGSVSLWVRNVALTDKQRERLTHKRNAAQIFGSRAVADKYRKLRACYQEEGRQKARQFGNDPLFVMGCMLYWAEGSKSRTVVSFSNNDAAMLSVFIDFLETFFDVDRTTLAMNFNCYISPEVTLADVKRYWSETLRVPEANVRKPTVKRTTTRKHRHYYERAKFGLCCISVTSGVRIVQQIYGAIQELTGHDNDTWIQ